MVKDLLFRAQPEKSMLSEIGLTALRVFVGLTMAFGHGLQKMPPSDMMIQSVGGMGFPMPGFFAWAAGLSEFAGGLFLALGLLTRPSAFFIAFTMMVAGFVRHAEDPFQKKELALLYFMVCVFFTLRGSSRWSVDRYLA